METPNINSRYTFSCRKQIYIEKEHLQKHHAEVVHIFEEINRCCLPDDKYIIRRKFSSTKTGRQQNTIKSLIFYLAAQEMR